MQVTSSEDRVDTVHEGAMSRDRLYKGGIGAPCKSEDDQSLRPHCGLQTMLRASTAVIVDCEPPK